MCQVISPGTSHPIPWTQQLLKAFNEDYRNVTHISCIAHVLNIAVQNALKEIQNEVNEVSKLFHFITFSGKMKQIFEECCVLLHVKHSELVKDMPVRWNSTYLMVERAIKAAVSSLFWPRIDRNAPCKQTDPNETTAVGKKKLYRGDMSRYSM